MGVVCADGGALNPPFIKGYALPTLVIPAQAEALFNSEAGQSSPNMRPKDTKVISSASHNALKLD
jgi:hypothetical protein